MPPHPQLWPALIGAILGLGLVAVGGVWLARRWGKLSPRLRWGLFGGLAILEVACWLNIYAWLIEPNMLLVRRVTIESAHWQGPPLRIAVLGDVHIGSPHVRAARALTLVRRINAERADLVVLLGDYVGGHRPRETRSAAEQNEINNGLAAFGALDARYGAAAVIGNHDDWYDRGSVIMALENAGVGVVVNRHFTIARSSGRFVIAGLDDRDTGAPDYARAIDGAPEGAPVLLLTHNPDVFPNIPEGPALILAAHTHCGQVSLPFLGRPILPSVYGQKFACGLIAEDGKEMFVTGGVGTSILPVRFFNPPEIVIVTLRAVGSRE
ncbi:MAG: metallophosphoesterase [Hyphomonadaceae bacterium]